MKKFILKVLSAVILVSFVLSALVPANAYGYFAIEYDHQAVIIVSEVSDSYGTMLSQYSDDYHDMTLAHDVKGEYVTAKGLIACDVKIKSFGFAYEGDDTAYVGSEKIVDENVKDMLEHITGTTGETVRFSVDVPVYTGEHTFYLVVVLEDDAIYEIARITYTGVENGTDLPKEADISVHMWVVAKYTSGAYVTDSQYFTVPAYIDEGYFIIDMTDLIGDIEEKAGKRFGVVDVQVNGKETEFDGYYTDVAEDFVVVYGNYSDGYDVKLRYEEIADVTLVPNYEGAAGTDTVEAVRGCTTGLISDLFMQKGKFIVDWNTEPDGSGRSFWAYGGNIAFPKDDPYVDLYTLTLYAIWADLGEPGDINGDGEVNNKDVVVLFKYLSGVNTECDKYALDVNNDGYNDNKDTATLFRYVSGGDVNAFYSGYAAKLYRDGFRFDMPGGFMILDDSWGIVTLISSSGDMIWAEVTDAPEGSFADLPDEYFADEVIKTYTYKTVKILNTERTKLHGRDAAIVTFTINGGEPDKIAFVSGGEKMLTLAVFALSEDSAAELEAVIPSVR